ncbi:unnamed protein product [Rotaria sp. Silwood1]|nr:unnamed protein product [Rotaria sp. Silwood1]CAF1577652.1 unnamed protein product [Rotaria sp. Silwood1]CAF5028325.1 unnamed protein product [Rotaria sp. Silwood1]
MGHYGITALHVANIYEYNQAVQLLLTTYDESKMDEIKKLFLKNSNLFHSHEEMQHYDYIEWSLIGNNLIEKQLLIEIIEYLIQQEQFSRDETKKLDSFFKQAIQVQNYLKYFIKYYILTNNFYRVLNKHLALYILDYFDTSSYSPSQTKYHLINCLVYIVTLLIKHPDIHKYKYKCIAYRGLLMTRIDLEHYTIGTHILNRSFVSIPKNRSVGQTFADNSQQNVLQQTSDHHDLVQVSVLLKYTIKQNQTAVDIEHISMIEDQKRSINITILSVSN